MFEGGERSSIDTGSDANAQLRVPHQSSSWMNDLQWENMAVPMGGSMVGAGGGAGSPHGAGTIGGNGNGIGKVTMTRQVSRSDPQ